MLSGTSGLETWHENQWLSPIISSLTVTHGDGSPSADLKDRVLRLEYTISSNGQPAMMNVVLENSDGGLDNHSILNNSNRPTVQATLGYTDGAGNDYTCALVPCTMAFFGRNKDFPRDTKQLVAYSSSLWKLEYTREEGDDELQSQYEWVSNTQATITSNFVGARNSGCYDPYSGFADGSSAELSPTKDDELKGALLVRNTGLMRYGTATATMTIPQLGDQGVGIAFRCDPGLSSGYAILTKLTQTRFYRIKDGYLTLATYLSAGSDATTGTWSVKVEYDSNVDKDKVTWSAPGGSGSFYLEDLDAWGPPILKYGGYWGVLCDSIVTSGDTSGDGKVTVSQVTADNDETDKTMQDMIDNLLNVVSVTADYDDTANWQQQVNFLTVDPGQSLLEALHWLLRSRHALFWERPDGHIKFARPQYSTESIQGDWGHGTWGSGLWGDGAASSSPPSADFTFTDRVERVGGGFDHRAILTRVRVMAAEYDPENADQYTRVNTDLEADFGVIFREVNLPDLDTLADAREEAGYILKDAQARMNTVEVIVPGQPMIEPEDLFVVTPVSASTVYIAETVTHTFTVEQGESGSLVPVFRTMLRGKQYV